MPAFVEDRKEAVLGNSAPVLVDGLRRKSGRHDAFQQRAPASGHVGGEEGEDVGADQRVDGPLHAAAELVVRGEDQSVGIDQQCQVQRRVEQRPESFSTSCL